MLKSLRLTFQGIANCHLPFSNCALPFALCLLLFAFSQTGCQNSEYDKLVRSELARGVRVDSLFLGLHFGDSKKDFFDKCRKMNAEGVTEDGSSAGLNVQVLQKVDTTLTDKPIYKYFYPEFDDKFTITGVPVNYAYVSYFPYIERYKSKALLPQVVKLLEHEYGKFLVVAKPGKDTIYVRVDANRRIVVSIKDDQFVLANFTDLTKLKK